MKGRMDDQTENFGYLKLVHESSAFPDPALHCPHQSRAVYMTKTEIIHLHYQYFWTRCATPLTQFTFRMSSRATVQGVLSHSKHHRYLDSLERPELRSRERWAAIAVYPVPWAWLATR